MKKISFGAICVILFSLIFLITIKPAFGYISDTGEGAFFVEYGPTIYENNSEIGYNITIDYGINTRGAVARTDYGVVVYETDSITAYTTALNAIIDDQVLNTDDTVPWSNLDPYADELDGDNHAPFASAPDEETSMLKDPTMTYEFEFNIVDDYTIKYGYYYIFAVFLGSTTASKGGDAMTMYHSSDDGQIRYSEDDYDEALANYTAAAEERDELQEELDQLEEDSAEYADTLEAIEELESIMDATLTPAITGNLDSATQLWANPLIENIVPLLGLVLAFLTAYTGLGKHVKKLRPYIKSLLGGDIQRVKLGTM